MKSTVFVTYLVITSLLSLPLAQAQLAADDQVKVNSNAIAQLESPEVTTRVASDLAAHDMILLTNENQPTTFRDVLQNKKVNFAIAGTSNLGENRYAIQYIVDDKNALAPKVVLAVYKYEQNTPFKLANAITTTSLTFAAGENAQQIKEDFARSVRVLQASVAQYAANHHHKSLVAKVLRLLVPEAQADLSDVANWIENTAKTVFVVGLVSFVAGIAFAVGAAAAKLPILVIPAWFAFMVGGAGLSYGFLGWVLGFIFRQGVNQYNKQH